MRQAASGRRQGSGGSGEPVRLSGRQPVAEVEVGDDARRASAEEAGLAQVGLDLAEGAFRLPELEHDSSL